MKKFHITENGFSMDGSGKVRIPACTVLATSYIHAVEIVDKFLETRIKPACMELITPMQRINFDDK